MCWSRGLAALLGSGIFLSTSVWADKGDYVLAAGLSMDNEDGKAVTALVDYSIADTTWVTAALGHSGVDLPRFQSIDTWYADLGLDTYWEPAGIRFGIAYWGDDELLDSIDLSTAIYTRNERSSLEVSFEFRDFELDLPPVDLFPRTNVPFNAKGLGLSGRFDLSDKVDARLSGTSYEYNVDLRSENAARFLELLSISRLSLLSSLIDWNVSAGLGVDFGLRRLQLDVATWRGAIDGGDNRSITLSFITPMTLRTDIELSLGYDDSELYGQVYVFSAYVYFYGGT